MKFIGEKLRLLRKAKNKTMTELEHMTGIKQGMLSQIENNHKNPRHATATKIADALGVAVEYFYIDSSRLPIELLPEMDEATKEFIMNAQSMPYIILSREAMKKGIPAEALKAMLDALTKIKCKN